MKRHLETCSGKKVQMTKGQVVIMCQVEAGVISTNPTKLMMNEVFPSMQVDEVGNVAKKDLAIIALGESWIRRIIDNREKRRYYTSQHMRLMAKMLIALRKLDSEKEDDDKSKQESFIEYLNPRKFDLLVAAALECCFPYMDDMEEMKSPSNGIKIKYDLRRMLNTQWAITVKNNPHALQAKELKICLKLINDEWGERITKISRAVMVRRQLGIKKELPAPSDIQKLTTYVVQQLKSVELKPENFKRIVQLSQTRILLYNKRRSGEIDAIRLVSYAARSRNLDDLDESLVGQLNKVETYLLKSQDLLKVRGKGNRPVPVLIPIDVQKPLDYISSRETREEVGVPDQNDYLFPLLSNKSGFNPSRCYEALKMICSEITLSAPSRINSVSMRKYTATLTQMINLEPHQMEWMWQHLGDTGDVHKTHYRQMSGFIERVQLTKLFLLQDLNLTNKYKGQKLDEIDVKDIVFPEESSEVQDEVNERLPQEEREDGCVDDVAFDFPDQESENEEPEVEEEEEVVETKKKKEKVKATRKRWDEVEVKEVKKYFKTYLNSGICPRNPAVEAAKKKSKSANGKIWMRSNKKSLRK